MGVDSDSDSDSTTTATAKDSKIIIPSTSTSQLLSRTQQLLSQASDFLERGKENSKSDDEPQPTIITDEKLKPSCSINGGQEALDMQDHAEMLKEMKQNVDQIINSWPTDSCPMKNSSSNSP